MQHGERDIVKGLPPLCQLSVQQRTPPISLIVRYQVYSPLWLSLQTTKPPGRPDGFVTASDRDNK